MTALPRIRCHTDGRTALCFGPGLRWHILSLNSPELHCSVPSDCEPRDESGWAELFVAERPELGSAEAVFITRADLIAGMLVGITGEHDATPSMEQLDRAADLIMRAGRARRIAMERIVDAIEQHREVLP